MASSCAPKDYVSQLSSQLQSQAGTTGEQSACVVDALFTLITTDDDVLTQAASDKDTADWPQAQRDAFKNALLTCVPEDLAEKIINL